MKALSEVVATYVQGETEQCVKFETGLSESKLQALRVFLLSYAPSSGESGSKVEQENDWLNEALCSLGVTHMHWTDRAFPTEG